MTKKDLRREFAHFPVTASVSDYTLRSCEVSSQGWDANGYEGLMAYLETKSVTSVILDGTPQRYVVA
jgi:hypothetical protein